MTVSYTQRVLANGLTVVAEVDPGAHSAACGFFVRTGARDERSELMGVSHFLEHMMFKGTEEIGADQLNQRFDAMGAKNNAYTSGEMTCFYAHVLPERLLEATGLIGHMMRPALRQAEFDTEKNVILEEIAMYKDNPFWVLYEAVSEAHYNGHPLGHRVLGTEETVGGMQRDAMMAYFRARYSADNTVVSLAGRLDFEAACDTIERACGAWERTGARRDRTPARSGAAAMTLRDESVSRAYLLAVSDAPAADDEARYAASLAAQLLGASDNSLLHWALIEPGIAEEAQAAYSAHDGCGELFVYASGEPADAERIWSLVEDQTSRLREACTASELERLRTRIATGATLSGERPSDRMQRLGRLWTTIGRYIPLEDELARINAVTVDDVVACVDRLVSAPRTFGRLLPADA